MLGLLVDEEEEEEGLLYCWNILVVRLLRDGWWWLDLGGLRSEDVVSWVGGGDVSGVSQNM